MVTLFDQPYFVAPMFLTILAMRTMVILYSCTYYYLTLLIGKEVQQLLGHQDSVTCLALSRSETILASGSWDKTVILWNMDSYEQLFVLKGKRPAKALDFSVDGQRLFTGSDDGMHFNL